MTHYKARYIPLNNKPTETSYATLKPYYRTITNADSLNDAIKQAERWTRKGFICARVIKEEGGEL